MHVRINKNMYLNQSVIELLGVYIFIKLNRDMAGVLSCEKYFLVYNNITFITLPNFKPIFFFAQR